MHCPKYISMSTDWINLIQKGGILGLMAWYNKSRQLFKPWRWVGDKLDILKFVIISTKSV